MLLSLPPLLSRGTLPQPCPSSSSSPSLSLSLFCQVTTNRQPCPVSTLQERAGLRRQQVPRGGLLLRRGGWGPGLVIPGRSGEPASLPHRDQGREGGVAGRRPLRLSTQSLDTLALAPFHSPSVLLAAPSQPPTTAPALERFTINFTITNLPYNSDLATPDSAKSNATQRVMATLVSALLPSNGRAPGSPIHLRGVQGDGQGLTVKPLSSTAQPPSEGKQHWARFPWM